MRLGFEREGMTVAAAASADAAAFDDVAVVVAGADAADDEPALLIRELVARAASGGSPPLLYVGNGIARGVALAAGATAVLSAPAYVRDVVTIGRILAGRRPGNRSVMDGDLGQTFGVFYLVRALARTGATGTLLMLRGLRRGEIRFFEGEVTSAQVGGLHGQAALDQLLLWTEARFELRDEPVVRRQQIPLTLDELLGHAERFLCDLREAAGSLSPSAVYEQDQATVAAMGRQLPTEVHGVLRMFDGHRTVADVLEDSPFRILETLRVAERAAQVGLLKKLVIAKQRNTHRAMLAVEEWLVGGATGEVARPVTPEGSGPVGGGKKKKGRPSGAQDVVKPKAIVEVDWAALVPRAAGLDAGAVSPVVPSSMAKGEFEVRARAVVAASRDHEREKLETLTDAGERDRLFAPLVEVAERDQLDAEEQEWLESEKKSRHEAVEAELRAKAEAAAKVKADADEAKRAVAAAEAAARAEKQAAAAAKAKAEADARAKAEAEKAAVVAAKAKAEVDARAKASAEKQAAVAAKAKAEVDAKAKAEADKKAKADAKARTEADVKAKAVVEKQAAAAKLEAARVEAARVEAAQVEAVKAEAVKAEAAKVEAARVEAAKVEAAKVEAAQVEAVKAEAAKVEAAKVEAAQVEAAQVEEAKAEAAKAETATLDGDAAVKAKDGAESERKPAATSESSGELSGEFRTPKPVPAADPAVAGPSILVEELSDTRVEARSIAEAATSFAAAAAATAAAKDPPRAKRKSTAPPAAAQPAVREADKARADAQATATAATGHFSDDEEAFFQAGQSPEKHDPAESFDDLDAGYQRLGFWDRLVGRKPPPSRAGTKKAPAKKPTTKKPPTKR